MGDVSTPHGTPLGLDPLVTPVAQATTVDGVSGGSTDVAVTRSQKRKRDEKEALEVSRHSPVSRVCGVGRARRRRFGHRRARDPRTRAPSLRRVFPFSVLTAKPSFAQLSPPDSRFLPSRTERHPAPRPRPWKRRREPPPAKALEAKCTSHPLYDLMIR